MDEYALTEVDDVAEVLCWAGDHARGRQLELFAEIDEEPAGPFENPRTAGLIRLLGSNLNARDPIEAGCFASESGPRSAYGE